MNSFASGIKQLLIRKQVLTDNIFRSLSRSSVYNLQFKSIYSLENLYPKSNTKLYTPTFVPEDASAKFSGFIPMRELQVTYSHSSGPGGMGVNSTNTKVDLRFHVKSATWLTDEIKEKLLAAEKYRINKDGYFVIKSELTRSQYLNVADALHRLRTMIRKCVVERPPISPETEEQIRKRQIKASRQRIFEKRQRSEIKQSRNACDFN